ncbi:MAG: hypothetical protein K1X44_05800 [Alphaproteobacteria bacterium]|nr:hypothetical protein [Alphaproteobacteria bacterium]
MGNDIIKDDGGNNYLYGEKGDDTIESGNGNDILSGGEGNDKIYGGAGKNVFYGAAGADYTSGGNDDYYYDANNDFLDDPTIDTYDLFEGNLGVNTVDLSFFDSTYFNIQRQIIPDEHFIYHDFVSIWKKTYCWLGCKNFTGVEIDKLIFKDKTIDVKTLPPPIDGFAGEHLNSDFLSNEENIRGINPLIRS